jgi:cellulose synthase (UDP-forming)
MKLSRLIQLFILFSVVLSIMLTSTLVVLAMIKTCIALLHLDALPFLNLGPALSAKAWLNVVYEAWEAPQTSLGLPVWHQTGISLAIILLTLLIGTFTPKKGRQFLILVTIFSITRHMLWRGMETITPEGTGNLVATWFLYTGELMAYVSLLLGYFQVWNPTNRAANPPYLKRHHQPTVDIMVCTYNEPLSVLYRTLVGCNAIAYEHKRVYLLDDGSRHEMRQLAEHLGVHYISRHENTHAKAGNLNNAMQHTQGDLVLVLDADHVPTQHILTETVPFFQQNTQLGFLQTPQNFFSLDPFQRNLVADHVVSNEQDFFYHVIQSGNDHWGATFFAGTGAIFRRAALKTVGGFATETITEDTHTGIRLHGRGWESVMYNKNLTAGMAQDSFGDFVKQRLRWARGMAQIIFHDNPLFAKGLSLPQRLCYSSGVWYFFTGPMRLIFVLTPLLYLLFGLRPIEATITEILIYYLPSFVSLYWGYSILSRGTRHLFWSEVYETSVSIYHTLAAYGTLISPFTGKFNVTPKGELTEHMYFNWRLVWPQLFLSLLIGLGLVVAAYRSFENPAYLGGLFTNFFWGVYNLSLLLGAIYVAQERPQFRLAPRVNKRIRCELRLLDGTIAVGHVLNLSESGLAVLFPEPIPVAGTLSLKLFDWSINETSIFNTQVVRSYVDPDTKEHTVGLRVVNRTDDQHQRLVRHMFSSAAIWNQKKENVQSWNNSLLSMLNTVFRLNRAEERPYRRRTPRFQVFLPASIENAQGTLMRAFTNEVSETGLSIVMPEKHPYHMNEPVQVEIKWSNGHSSRLATTVKRIIPFQHKQVLIGMNFVGLSREERLEVIEQIYGPREGLVRIAPSSAVQVPCRIELTDGRTYKGTSTEISEMGVRLRLDREIIASEPLAAKVQIHWPRHSSVTYQATFVPNEISGEDPGISLFYFEIESLDALDTISRQIYDSPLTEPLAE